MTHPDYNSPSELKNFLDSRDMGMQKKFGQNFMINENARKRIIQSLEPGEDDSIWEIGPGLGCMTELILNSGAKLTAFEIDRGFIGCLKEFFEDKIKTGKFSIVEGDVLKNWKKEAEVKKASKLFGNLPYNIAATFIADTIAAGLIFDRCVFTVQKEVAMRMWAKAGEENYSSFSVLCQYFYDVTKGFELGAGNFWPKPNVASHSVLFTRKKDFTPECDTATFVKIVHALFASRRKTVANNIKGILNSDVNPDEFFAAAEVDKSLRAETLTTEDFVRLAKVYEKMNIKKSR
ncbi:16S rRNA (adenine(1518)-N(6)/adenine(1519)-N(6))-dimethyltransferase RsmA [Treponema sp.]|uniref:16S rRNA (adenine(1518)-N(6)/adenine(1519)-N(6))- dimethyltransferase RsmA n=1 Tax=Treponema sp. TaxID=166 RepID=UPI0025F5E52D|nr:16S rRNA (adenine(1518)-N(6)/adenine(1519)-N(6))-dimethyltransferase RsmA [Treponema sp.]MCR5218432.1 16S rRNA (adenine(1518)-N(6)/adenine(1519)-N(6))-dimethyltransferase RsmA [Treponema sp.]